LLEAGERASTGVPRSAGDFAQMLAGDAGIAAMWAALGTGVGAVARNQV
jgi:hypothetical protein